jgi:hypothetical protein
MLDVHDWVSISISRRMSSPLPCWSVIITTRLQAGQPRNRTLAAWSFNLNIHRQLHEFCGKGGENMHYLSNLNSRRYNFCAQVLSSLFSIKKLPIFYATGWYRPLPLNSSTMGPNIFFSVLKLGFLSDWNFIVQFDIIEVSCRCERKTQVF